MALYAVEGTGFDTVANIVTIATKTSVTIAKDATKLYPYTFSQFLALGEGEGVREDLAQLP